MFSCEKASKLTSKKIDLDLSFTEKVMLKFHTMMCGACASFEDEILTITDSIHKHDGNCKSSCKLNEDSKNKISEMINNHA